MIRPDDVIAPAVISPGVIAPFPNAKEAPVISPDELIVEVADKVEFW